MKSPLDNLWHGGLEYIYPEDRGVGNSIEISKNYLISLVCGNYKRML